MAQRDGAALVAACLRATGARRIFVAPADGVDGFIDALVGVGLEVVPVLDDESAIVLADADGALATAPDERPGVALLSGRRLRLTSRPGAVVEPLELPLVDLPAAIAGWSLGRGSAAIEIELPDLGAEVDDDVQPLVVKRDERLVRLSAGLAGGRTVLLIGGRVIREGQAAEVAGAAERTGADIVATPAAAGVVPASHPRWCGVVGVQRDDAIGTGLDEADLLIAVGVDDDEPGAVIPDAAQLIDIEPWHLAFLGLDWPEPPPGERSPLVEHLDALVAAHRTDDSLPLHPIRAALDVLDAIGDDDRIAVDAGSVGLWFVRGALPVGAGRVVAPLLPADGFAAAAALVGALDGRRVVGLTTPGGARTAALLDLASSLGLGVVVEQWGDDVAMGDASRHRADLVGALADGGTHLLSVAVDVAAATELIEIAGPVVLWVDEKSSLD